MSVIKYLSSVKKINWLLLAPVLLLIILGLATLYTMNLNTDNPDWTALNKQLLLAGVGLVFFFITAFFDYRRLANYSRNIYLFSLLLLGAVLIWGRTIRGTTGWFSFGGFSFQPVELAKLALVLQLASFYNRRRGREKETSTGVLMWVTTLLPVGLTILQPDLGSAAMLLVIGGGFFALLSLRPKQLILIFFIALVVVTAAWNFFLLDYQKNRILTFVDPMRDPLGRGYNVRQSIIAIGSGQLWGRGLGLGTQSQLRFLPETVTDFIFATIAESLGLLGATLVIALFGWLWLQLIIIIKNARDNLSAYLVYGFGLGWLAQATINIGMNMGILPVTGLPLPFVSYGGSFLVLSLIALGVIENVAIRQKMI